MDPHQTIRERGYNVVTLDAHSNLLGRTITSRFFIVVLCLQGEVEWEMNLERIKASTGMRIVYPHVSMLRPISVSPDFRAIAVVVDDDFAIEVSSGIDTDSMGAVFVRPVGKVESNRAWDMLHSVVHALEQHQSMPLTHLSRQVAGTLLRTMLLVLCEASKSGAGDQVSTVDQYFRSFVNLLSLNVRTQHEALFYADALGITPRYLADVSKAKTGRTAKEIISTVLVAHIKRELIAGQLSMKDIAERYGFSDQSSMGKFFRKIVGESPLAFRNNNR